MEETARARSLTRDAPTVYKKPSWVLASSHDPMEVEEEEEVRVALSLLGKTRLQMFRYGAISVEETSRSHPRNVVAVPAASCRLHRRQKPQPVGDLGGRRRGRGHEANLSMFFSFFFLFCFVVWLKLMQNACRPRDKHFQLHAGFLASDMR